MTATRSKYVYHSDRMIKEKAEQAKKRKEAFERQKAERYDTYKLREDEQRRRQEELLSPSIHTVTHMHRRTPNIDDLLAEAELDAKPWEVIVRQHSQNIPTTPIPRPRVRLAANRYASIPQRLERKPIQKRNVILAGIFSALAGGAYYASTIKSLSLVSITLALPAVLLISSFVLAGLAVVALAAWTFTNRNRLFRSGGRSNRRTTNPFDDSPVRSVI